MILSLLLAFLVLAIVSSFYAIHQDDWFPYVITLFMWLIVAMSAPVVQIPTDSGIIVIDQGTLFAFGVAGFILFFVKVYEYYTHKLVEEVKEVGK